MRKPTAALLLTAALVCAACTTAPTPSAPVPATPTTATPTTAAPTTPATTTSAAFDPATVPGCEDGCEIVVDVDLPDGARLVGLQGNAPDTGFPRALLARVAATEEMAGEKTTVVEPVESAYVLDARCGGAVCIATFGAGAQSVIAVAVRVGPDGVVAGEQVLGGTGDAVLDDLDGDGSPDIALRQITGEGGPAAPRYWETRTTDGDALPRTGCAEPTGPADEPAPTALLTGPCPTG